MLENPTIFYVIQRPTGAAFFNAATGSWHRDMKDVRHYSSALRAAMDAYEWALENVALVKAYYVTWSEPKFRPVESAEENEHL